MMSAVIQAVCVNAPVALRSIFPGRKTIRVPDPYRRRRPSHWSFAVTFVGHLATTAFVFLSFVTLVWGVSFAFSILQSANPLSADALRVFVALEGLLIRIDAAACGIVLFLGITRYVSNVVKGDS
jgi:hypothetical protein